MTCKICRLIVDDLEDLENVNYKSPFSKKPVYSIITYLAKTAKPSIDLLWWEQPYEIHVCKNCYNDILNYDEYMVKIIEVQKRIVSFLRKSPGIEDYVVEEEIVTEFKEDIDERIEKVEISLQTIESIDNGDNIKISLQTIEPCDDGTNFNNVSLNENKIKSEPTHYSEEFEDLKVIEEGNQSYSDETKAKSTKSGRKYNIPVKCNLCSETFKNKTQLRRHLNVEHKPNKSYKCDICSITAKDEEYLELHMNIHDGKSDLECRYCNKRYTRRINVIRHMHKHWDKKKFQCEKCGLRFSERPVYYNHRLKHEAEEEPLICAVCNQSFKTRRTYRNHLWVHRDDRPRYSCEFCGKTFVEKYTLRVHLRCHTDTYPEGRDGRRKTSKVLEPEDKPFECIICGDQFLTNSLCDHHMKAQHDVILKAENIFI